MSVHKFDTYTYKSLAFNLKPEFQLRVISSGIRDFTKEKSHKVFHSISGDILSSSEK